MHFPRGQSVYMVAIRLDVTDRHSHNHIYDALDLSKGVDVGIGVISGVEYM